MTQIIVTGGRINRPLDIQFEQYLLDPQVPGSSAQTSWPVEGLEVITALDPFYEGSTLTLFLLLDTVSEEISIATLIAGLSVRAQSFVHDYNIKWCKKVSVIPLRQETTMVLSVPIEREDRVSS